MSQNRFEYTPIDLATDAIRLVRLIKGSDYDPIVCELFETFLHQVDGTPYEALSYTWGKSEELIDITLCGKKTSIRDNLFTALWYLRKPDEDRLLWVDAICIDQDSHREKGHQVGQMRLIYENAQKVHVWLGESTEDIDMLMNHMKQLDKRAIRRPDYRRNSPLAWENEWPILRDELDMLGANQSNFHDRRCRAAKDLLGRPWFRRVWILQEVFSAKVATVGCGWNTLPTRTFVLLPKLLGLEGTLDPHVQAVLEIMPGYLRQRSWHNQSPTLHSLIRKFAACEATDPRDNIYALIGISSDAGSDGKLQPDYDNAVTMGNVIHRTIMYILLKEDTRSPTCGHGFLAWSLHTLAGMNMQDLLKAALNWALGQPSESHTACRLLTQTELDPNGSYTDNTPPLMYLAMANHYLDSDLSGWRKLAEELLRDPRVDVNITTPFSVDSPLNRAVVSKNTEMVRLLVRHPNIDVNHLNDKGKTPLWLAVEDRFTPTDIINILLEHPNIDVNYGGCAALWEVLREGYDHCRPIINALLQNGKINISGLQVHYGPGWTNKVLEILADRASDEALVRVIDLLKRDQIVGLELALSTALLQAASRNHVSTVALLLDCIRREPERLAILGAKSPLDRQKTALHVAVENAGGNMPELISMMVSAGVPVNKRGPVGYTALWAAAQYGRTDLVEILLDHGADVNAKNDLGQSPLWRASCGGYDHTVKLLVQRGADIQESDQQRGWTPLFVAAFERHEKVVRYLLEAGADPQNLRSPVREFSDSGWLVENTMSYLSRFLTGT